MVAYHAGLLFEISVFLNYPVTTPHNRNLYLHHVFKSLIISVVTFLLSISCFAQYGKDRYVLDSLQVYTSGKQEYFFTISGGKQGLFVDNYDQKAFGKLFISLINNTKDTLLSDFKIRDKGITWFKEGSHAQKMAPGDTARFFSGWSRTEGAINSSLEFNYVVSGKNTNVVYQIWGTFRQEVIPVQSKQPVIVPSQKTYYPNGFIKTETTRTQEFHYSEKVNGQLTRYLLGDSIHTSRVIMEYDNGEMFRKTSTQRINYLKDKIPYTVSEGKFLNNELYEGVIHFYSVDDDLVVSVLVEEGKQLEGFLYKGERCNLVNSQGQRNGKWISFLPRGGYCSHYSIADYACNYVYGVEMYQNGLLVDTAFTYYKNGKIRSVTLFPGDLGKRFMTSYLEDGSVKHTSSNFKLDANTVYEVYTEYSDSGCVLKKTLGKANEEVEYTYSYVNCRVHAKISARKSFYYDTIEVASSIYIGEVEGPGKEITTVKRELGRIPKTIPYTIETGEFNASELYLVNGTIEYRDRQGKLLKIRKVINGVIVEDE